MSSPADYEQDRPDTPYQEALELLASLAPFPIGPRSATAPLDWLRIIQAIRRGSGLSLEAQCLGWTLSIHFHDVSPFEGAYQIRVPLEHLNEHGSIVAVDVIRGNRLVDHRHAMLRSFELRYLVTTAAAGRSRTHRT